MLQSTFCEKKWNKFISSSFQINEILTQGDKAQLSPRYRSAIHIYIYIFTVNFWQWLDVSENYKTCFHNLDRSQWPFGLRRVSSATRFLGLLVRIPPRAWMYVSFECCVLLGRSICVGPITRTEESYRVWCVWV